MIEIEAPTPIREIKMINSIYARTPSTTILLSGLPPTVNHAYRRRGGNSSGLYMTKAARLWKDAAAWEVRIAYRKQKPLKGRVAVLIMFYPKTRGRWDIDNRIKSCLDAITAGGVWQDDRQIDHLGVEVRAGQTQNPYTEVYVWELKKGMTT